MGTLDAIIAVLCKLLGIAFLGGLIIVIIVFVLWLVLWLISYFL